MVPLQESLVQTMMSPRSIENSIGRMGLARVAPWLAVIFVLAQLIATAHSAAFAESEHTHDGHPCIIAATCKHSADADSPKHVVLLNVPEWHIFYVAETSDVWSSCINVSAGARGPPSNI